MINTNILSSIFDNYSINKVILLEDTDCYNFIISNMPSSINLDRWEYLENILKEILRKNINIIPHNQAIEIFDNNAINEGLVIKQ